MAPARSSLRPVFVCADIGRGHPFYLDGLRHELERLLPPGVQIDSLRAAELSGAAGRLAWLAIRQLYLLGSSPGPWSFLYARLRRNSDYNRDQAAIRFLRSSLRDGVRRIGRSPIVVSHPLLVSALRPHPCVIYQHGEGVTPGEAVVLGAHRVLVPTASAAEPFIAAGYDPSDVWITGLCIEPDLVVQDPGCYERRLERLATSAPLTGAYFSSGAEPSHHIQTLVASAVSALRSGGLVHVFAARGQRLAEAVHGMGQRLTGDASRRLVVHTFDVRAELDRLTALHFHAFDYFMSPPHERSNWALGLGLPMFLAGPDVGPFAPLNRRLLLEAGVARPVTVAEEFGAWLSMLRSEGTLSSMARSGRDRHSILGFAQGARHIVDLCNGLANGRA